jgi:EamA domain-containing membrane protein RarD
MTSDLFSEGLEDPADLWTEGVAPCLSITARISVYICALKIFTSDGVTMWLWNVAAGTFVDITLALFTTALVKICVSTVDVITQYVSGVMSVAILWGT